MTDKQSTVLTFHQVRTQCETPSAEAWRAFLSWYSPLYLHLLEIYAGGDSSIWEQTLRSLVGDNFAKFRAMSRQSEREFLAELRGELFEVALAHGGAGLATSDAGAGAPVLDLDRAAKLVEGLPLLHQEILWFKLAGYTDATLEGLERVSPAVARAALERLSPDFAAARELTRDRCLWPASWPGLLHQARAAKKEDCPPLHQLMRIQDGQVSWYDKEPVEKRVAGCLHCLDNWTGLREVGYWRRAAPAVSPELIERFLQCVPAAETRKKSLLQRVFGS